MDVPLDKRKHLMKNPMLCKGFKSKADKLPQNCEKDWQQVLNLLNISLTFAPIEEEDLIQKLIFERAEILEKMDSQLRDGIDLQKEANIG